MPSFRRRPDHELQTLSDDGLIGYIRAARDAGDAESAQRGLQILVYGHWDNVVRRVRIKVPAADVEDVAGEVIVSAIRSAFDGESEGEFRVWLRTITNRRVADYHRSREGDPKRVALRSGDEDEPGVDPGVAAGDGYVEVQDAIARVLDRLSDDHERVVRLNVFEQRDAGETAQQIPGMTPANVHQIVRRFRKALQRELGDTGEDEDGS